MTLYIVQSDRPDIVQKFNNVVEVIADRELRTVYLKQVEFGRHKPHSTERYKYFTHHNLVNVKGIESN